MTALHDIDISEAVNDQHAKNSRGQKLSDVLNECGGFFILTEYDERKKTCGHRTKDTKTDGDDLLCKCHVMIPPVLVVFWDYLHQVCVVKR